MKAKIFSACMLAGLVCGIGCSRGEVAAKVPPVRIEETSDVNLLTVAHPQQFPLVSVVTQATRDELSVNGGVAPDVN
ncbi:MAG TPA: hypothetical protein VKT29_01610, partial [Terriglobales bacterium]|nr:hypothetical protein [Terriglobales bacterium]